MEKEWHGCRLGFGDVTVTFITFMYKKIRFYDRDSIGFGKVDLPPVPLETCGMWLVPPVQALHAVRMAGRSPAEGMLGLANVFGEVIGLYVMCDPQDVGTVVDSSNTGAPTLFLYDRYPGGVGFAAKGYELVEEILEACCDLIHDCECEGGCPSCVGSPIPPYVQGEADGEALGVVPTKRRRSSSSTRFSEKSRTFPSFQGVPFPRGRIAGGGRGDRATCCTPSKRTPARAIGACVYAGNCSV